MSVDLVTRRPTTEAGESRPLTATTMTATRREWYDVTVTDTGDTPDTILQSPLVPQDRSPHPDGLYLRATNRQVRKKTPIYYEMSVDYEATGLAPSPNGQSQNPLNAAPKIKFLAEDDEEPIDRDVDGNAIIMVTGEEFEPRITEINPQSIVLVQRNVTWVNPLVMESYRNVVNSDNFYGMAPGTCLMRRLEAESVESEDFVYWTVSATIAMRSGERYGTTDEKAWHQRVLAQGYMVIAKLFGQQLVLLHANDHGEKVTKPVLHRIYGPDGVTLAAKNGDPGNLLGERIRENANAQWYRWKTKKAKPFGTLGLI